MTRARTHSRAILFAALFAAATCVVPGRSTAQNVGAARHDVSEADDFRVRLAAALTLGKAKPPDARALLEKALSDPHPAVRTAAAAALGSLGDPAAIPAVEHHLSTEGSPSVQSQLRTTLASLRGSSAAHSGKWIVQLGNMHNATSVRGEQLAQVLRTSAVQRAASIPGAVVANDTQSALREAQSQHIPVLLLDGSVTRLLQKPQGGGQIGVSAAVEFSVRKIPEHVLKASLSGAATSIGTASSMTTRERVSALQDQAVDGAVESALRGADRGLALAAQ